MLWPENQALVVLRDILRRVTGLGRASHSRVIRALAAAGVIAAISLAGALPIAAQPADTILLNGKVLTLDEQSSVVQALAIRDGKVIATGASADIVKHADAKTRIIDLDGRTAIPGLI